jgi:hypothetical protein
MRQAHFDVGVAAGTHFGDALREAKEVAQNGMHLSAKERLHLGHEGNQPTLGQKTHLAECAECNGYVVALVELRRKLTPKVA